MRYKMPSLIMAYSRFAAPRPSTRPSILS